ncbi:MAG: HIT family protein [Nitrospirae bacterium]|nr:HIT family protein [Nitrospirota bacterium]MCL5423121.1 HIT family protein [Nitrospirota bacterium]
MSTCPFCSLPAEDILDENECAVAVRDSYPVSEGHTLIITKRHVDDYFKLSEEEKKRALDLLERRKKAIDSEFNPDGYNIGINIGALAGQTIFHVHIHLIPRIKGDIENGGGELKGVIRRKMSY